MTIKEAMDRATQLQSSVWIWTDDMVTGYEKRDEWIVIDPIEKTFSRVNKNYVACNHGFIYDDLIRSDWKLRENNPTESKG
jgi:hypothetical protein